jgi:hypothetical protein
MFPARESIRALARSSQNSLFAGKVRCLFEKSFLRAAGATVGDAAQVVDLRGRAWICGFVSFSALGWRGSSHRSLTLHLINLKLALGVSTSYVGAILINTSDL